MKNGPKMKIVSFLLVILSAFLFLSIAENKQIKAIDSSKTVTTREGVSVQVNDGNQYFARPHNIKIEVDASGNEDVKMFSVVICKVETGECSLLDNKYRYTDLVNGKSTVEADLNWIRENNKKFILTSGEYKIRVKPETKTCYMGIFCSPITDVIDDDDPENRYIDVYVNFRPLGSDDIKVSYNSVELSNEETTVLDAPKLRVSINRYNEVYQEEITAVSYKYCLANNNWETSWTNSANNCKKANLTLSEGSAELDLSSDKKLEGNYILSIEVSTTTDRKFTDQIKFTYDKTAPTVEFSKLENVEPTKEKSFKITTTDNSTTKTKYLVKDASIDTIPTVEEFEEFASSNEITISELSGEFILWVYVYDNSDNYTIAQSEKFVLDNSAPVIAEYEYYIDFLNKQLVISVKKVQDQVKEGILFYASLDGENYVEYTSNLIKLDIKDLIEQEIVAYIYAKDNLGNFDADAAILIKPVIEQKEVEITIEDANFNNYYSKKVTFNALGTDIVSIKVNSFEYINNRYYCSPILDENSNFLGFECSFDTDGIYTVLVTNASGNSNSINFIIDKDKIWNIDGIDSKIEEMFIVNVTNKGDKYYASMPISAYDLSKDIKLVYNEQNKYKHLSLKNGLQSIALNEIENPNEFLLPIDVLGYQKANYSTEQGQYYFLAYSIEVEREDNNVVVETPTTPEPEDKEEIENYPAGNEVTKDGDFSIKDIFTFKNILLVSIVVIAVIYVLKFFIYKKNIQTV